MTSFKGNKHYLPAKPCATCNRPMTWRKKWARNWGEVKYCSDACRRARSGGEPRTVGGCVGCDR